MRLNVNSENVEVDLLIERSGGTHSSTLDEMLAADMHLL